jgi:hypothetical protein
VSRTESNKERKMKMKMGKKCSRRAYALSSTMALIFLLSVLLGVAVTHAGYSSEIMGVYSRRVRARSELTSMTNLALKWLISEFEKGVRPRASIVNTYEDLTDFHSLSIFLSYSIGDDIEGEVEGKVEVFDLDYASESLAEPVSDPLLFPPSLPGGYMIRAVVAQKGLVFLTMESVYVSGFRDVPGLGVVYILEKTPVYWKESFR